MDSESSEEKLVWSTPLVILTDAQYVCSIYDADTHYLYVFAYMYSGTQGGSNTTGNDAYLSLVMYRVNINQLNTSSVQGQNATIYRAADEKTDNTIAYVRQPLASINDIKAGATPPGSVMVGSEYLIRILANDATGGNGRLMFFDNSNSTDVTQAYMNIEVLSASATFNEQKMISLYFQNISDGNIYLITSGDCGLTWLLTNNMDATGKLLPFDQCPIVKSAGSPTAYGDYFFYVQSGQLFMKRFTQAGNTIDAQGIRNQAPALPVALNILPQRLAVIDNDRGEIFIYFIQESGLVTGLVTTDGGLTWNPINNW